MPQILTFTSCRPSPEINYTYTLIDIAVYGRNTIGIFFEHKI